MPWNKRDYPDAMKNLPDEVRDKAIEIANALLEERHMEDGIAIATAISRAKDWAANKGLKSEAKPGTSHSTDVKHHGEDRYVMPGKEGWAVKVEGKNRKRHFDTKAEALKNATTSAKAGNASVTVKGKTGKMQSKTSYNPNRRAPKQG